MNCVVFYHDDAFELTFSFEGVESIVRYRHGIDGHGELVDFDSLSPQLQEKIYNKLRQELDYAKRFYQNGTT